MSFATHVTRWLTDEAAFAAQLAVAAQYAAWATLSPQGKHQHASGVLFKLPHKLDMQHLVPVERISQDGLVQLRLSDAHQRHRQGFGHPASHGEEGPGGVGEQ